MLVRCSGQPVWAILEVLRKRGKIYRFDYLSNTRMDMNCDHLSWSEVIEKFPPVTEITDGAMLYVIRQESFESQ
jgi:hypothetical protein